MNPLPDKRQWLAAYRARCEALERLQAQELASMTNEQAWRLIQSLNTVEPPWRERRDWSGLVEQQALFHRRSKP